MKSISALPNRLFTGPKALGFDPETGIITTECDPKLESTNHLMTIMGGFEIANEDLKLRGPGEFFGVKQSGTMNFALGDIYSNADILKMASEAVDYLKKEGYNFQKLHQYSLEKNLNFAKNI